MLVLYCLTHPLRGWSTVDEPRTKTADRVAKSHERASRENLALLLYSYGKLLGLPRGCFVLRFAGFPSVLSPTLLIFGGVFSLG